MSRKHAKTRICPKCGKKVWLGRKGSLHRRCQAALREIKAKGLR